MAPRSGGRSARFGRIAAANLLLGLLGVGAVALVLEVRLRRSFPFVSSRYPIRFVPEVGVLPIPHEEVRWTNLRDYWTIQRANRFGFLDREPVSAERAASSCHIALIGDSFTEGTGVAVPDKMQVALEALAARERPDLDITTAAYARRGTGTVQQIPLYDAFVRPRKPRVVVLVAATNDFEGNTGAWWEVNYGRQVAELYAQVSRGADGALRLRLPDGSSPAVREWIGAYDRYRSGLRSWLREKSYLWGRMDGHNLASEARLDYYRWRARRRWRRLAPDTPPLRGWRPQRMMLSGEMTSTMTLARSTGVRPPPVVEEAIEFTAFALDELKRRAVRDRFHLVVLLHWLFRTKRIAEMRELAEERGIPVIDLYEDITGKGREVRESRFPRDFHFSPTGHRWVAEAVWDYLREQPSLCEPARGGAADRG